MNRESDYLLESFKPENKRHSLTHNKTQRRRNPAVYMWILYTALITDWSWEIATYISGISENILQQKFLFCLQCFCSLTQLLIATMGLFCQSISCFRRDRLDENIILIPEDNNASKLVECHEASQLFSAILVPDMIIFLLLLWFLLRKFCKSSDLGNLVDKIKHKGNQMNL